jgi:hypothetical protein
MKKNYFRPGFFTFVFAVLIFTLSDPASALEVKLSGQINRAVLWADNGTDSELFFVDNDHSSTRIRVSGWEDLDSWGTVGFKGEWQFESNPSNEADIGINDDFGDDHFTERHMDIWFKSAYGKISLGQGDTASNGTSEVDLSGTAVIKYSGVVSFGGGLSFLAPDGTKLTTVDDTRSNFDGFSRRDRIRYDTSYLGPVTLSASYMNGDEYDVAARYSVLLVGVGRLAAAAAYAVAKPERSGDYDQFSSSFSFLHDSGFNITGAYAKRNYDHPYWKDPVNFYFKLGFKGDKHAFSVDWSRTEDQEINKGDVADTLGFGYVYNIIKGVELYGGYRSYSLDREGNAAMVGARVKF